MRTWICISLSLFLTSCGQDDLPVYSQLKGLRVLGLVASSPEALAGGGPVTITPYVSDIDGGGRSLQYDAEACLNLEVDYGGDPTCEGSSTRTVIAQGAAVTIAGNLTSSNGYTGSVDALSVSIPTSSSLSSFSALQKYNGVPLLVTYKIYASSGEAVRSYRRIYVTTEPSKVLNSNPIFLDILSDGSTLGPSLPTSAVKLSADFPNSGANGAEVYSEIESDGGLVNKTESLMVTWFVSAGSVAATRIVAGDFTRFSPPNEIPSLGRVIVVGVLRDNRGGLAVVRKELQ